MCYTYDSRNRVTGRTVKTFSDEVISDETFTYDAAGNITYADDSLFTYDTNNRLTVFNGSSVSYDLDGNMLSNGAASFSYDSGNRLVSAGGHSYTYDAEGVRVRNLCSDADTTYTYDTNCKLSRLLCKTTNGKTTKYVYGLGLIGEEKQCFFNTYHFDYRGSTVAITDECGNITDTFAYDTYGKLISRTGSTFIIFGYNGRDGVITDRNGLIYMRARYYSPEMRRFVNADIVAGKISNAVTLNRFAYANGNPVSCIDPFGLSAERTSHNNAIFNDMEGLYDLAFGYYNNKYSWFFGKEIIMSMANMSVMHYIMYKRFYNSSNDKSNLAWNVVAGVPDGNFIKYMNSHTEYSYLQDSKTVLYDLESSQSIDFVHMIGTIAANCNITPLVNKRLDFYAGWAGDLITLAGDAQEFHDQNPGESVAEFVVDALSNQYVTQFSLSDFLADVDAIGILQQKANTPIHTAFRNYYSNDYKNRYNIFIENIFDGDTSVITSTANSYLNPDNLLTVVFKGVFDSSYDKSIIEDVSNGFYTFLMAQI